MGLETKKKYEDYTKEEIEEALESLRWIFESYPDADEETDYNKRLRAQNFLDLPKVMQQSFEFVKEALEIDGYIYEYISDEFKNDKELTKTAIKDSPNACEEMPKEFWDDKEIVMQILSSYDCSCYLSNVSKRLRDDKEVVMCALSEEYGGSNLYYASDRLKDDKEVVLCAVFNQGIKILDEFGNYYDCTALEYASERLRDDEGIVLTSIDVYPNTICYASERLRNDKKIVLKALENNILTIKYVPKSMQNDREFLLEAFKNFTPYMSDEYSNIYNKDNYSEFLDDRDECDILNWLPKQILDDKEIMMEIIKEEPWGISFASKRLRDDKDIVMCALSDEDGKHYLRYASKRLKEDPEIIELTKKKK